MFHGFHLLENFTCTTLIRLHVTYLEVARREMVRPSRAEPDGFCATYDRESTVYKEK